MNGHEGYLQITVYLFIYLFISTQESYAMLSRHDLLVARDESERVDTIRYSWQKVLELAVRFT